MKGEIMFNNAHTIVISHYCVFTKTLPRLIDRAFRLLRLCRGCGFRPTAVNSRQPCSAKTRLPRASGPIVLSGTVQAEHKRIENSITQSVKTNHNTVFSILNVNIKTWEIVGVTHRYQEHNSSSLHYRELKRFERRIEIAILPVINPEKNSNVWQS
mgnify:CR=1 FL=1